MPNEVLDGIEASLNKEIKDQDRPPVKPINPINFKVMMMTLLEYVRTLATAAEMAVWGNGVETTVTNLTAQYNALAARMGTAETDIVNLSKRPRFYKIGTGYLDTYTEIRGQGTTNASGNLVINMPLDGSSNPVFNTVDLETLQVTPFDAATPMSNAEGTLSPDKKTLTVNFKKPGGVRIQVLTIDVNVLGAGANAVGNKVNYSIWVKQ